VAESGRCMLGLGTPNPHQPLIAWHGKSDDQPIP
jgi:hypothetical protein